MFSQFIENFSWMKLLFLLLSAVSVLFCMTVHELCHGLAAYLLGDPTAKSMGRLTLNPLKHVDPLGAVMLLVCHVGWAKPVQVDPSYFKDPKRGMALTALAGPVSNLLLTLVLLAVCSLMEPLLAGAGSVPLEVFFCFLCHTAVLSLGLGLFNLIPISPLDGSKVLLSFLPEKIYWTILRYERYIFILVLILSFSGAFSSPLSICIQAVLGFLCRITGIPLETVLYGSYLFSVLG